MLTAIVGNRKTVLLNPPHILLFKRHYSEFSQFIGHFVG